MIKNILNVLNIFNDYHKLPLIELINQFQSPKNLFINKINRHILISNDFWNNLILIDGFIKFDKQYINNYSYMSAIIKFLVDKANDKICTYNISCIDDIFKIKYCINRANTICVCLYDNKIRKTYHKIDPVMTCICGLFNYANKDIITHNSYGKTKHNASFNFENENILFDFIINSKYENKNKYYWVTTPSQYFQLYFDLDFKAQNVINVLSEISRDHIVELIIEVLSLMLYPLNSNIQYIYADKTNSKLGVHLYFPNIIVDKQIAIKITNDLIDKLCKLRFSNDVWKYIIDVKAIANGLSLLFQESNESYYKINCDKSTHYTPPLQIDQLKLTSLRCPYVTTTINY